MQGCIPLLRQTGGFGLVEVGSVEVWRGERTALSRPAAFSVSIPTGSKGFLCAGTHGAQRRVPVIPASGASCARSASAKGIFDAGDEDAGAAGLAPDALVARSGRTVVVVAREELALVDPQLPVKEVQLFYAYMSMRRVTGAGREPHQHADPVSLRVGREQLAFDAGRDLFPFRLGPASRRRRHRRFPGLLGDTTRQAFLQRGRRTQHIVGQATKLSITGRRLASSRWHSGHEAMWASAAASSLASNAKAL
jgi:hypothetical protein